MDQALSELSEGEASDDGLKIVIESPKRKLVKKSKSPAILNPLEKQIMDNMEQEFENTLEEKAAKSNLTTVNVKNILRQVVTNEHVLALVRQTENPGEVAPEPPFEPKLTRAKAKELFSTTTVTPLPWLTPTKPPSEVQQLISDELAEDSSGDEYVPVEEESEDDRDSSVTSETDIRSVSPVSIVSPVKTVESEVNWTDDGIFKIPPAKTKTDQEEEANIALRTRSKLSFTATPLETIEEAFIPPDITTDMYDMHCDDDDWRDFLKKFTRPLDEATKATEDEDHDPEYNILADEEIDEVDTEELRADKAVKVTRKELNELMAELFEYANAFTDTQEEDKNAPEIELTVEPQVSLLEDGSLISTEASSQNITNTTIDNHISTIEPASDESHDCVMRLDQKLLMEQQIRQHVQMLTQNFLLTYEHPEFHDMAIKFKEHLINFELLSDGNENSAFNAVNLEGALKVIANWEQQFQLNTDEVRATKQHVHEVVHNLKESVVAGTDYIPTFPPLVLETISKSDVFLYPALLPRIPFKSESLHRRPTVFVKSEDQLIALGMEQFTPYLAQDSYHLTYQGQVKLRSVCTMISQYMMPMKNVTKLYCHIFNSKHPRAEMNPIKYFFENKKAPVTMHYVISLKEFQAVAPNLRSKGFLPYQWRQYLYPEQNSNSSTHLRLPQNSTVSLIKPPTFKNFANRSPPKRWLAPKPSSSTTARRNLNVYRRSGPVSSFSSARNKSIFTSTPRQPPPIKTKKLEQYFRPSPLLGVTKSNADSCVRCIQFNSSVFERLRVGQQAENSFDMLPSMPFLGTSCASSHESGISVSEVSSITTSILKETTDGVCDRTVEADSTIADVDDDETIEKDNEDDINALMIASSTIKNLGRSRPSGAEKKKAKLRREYSATLAMLSPEDPSILQEKAQSYAQAYFNKARERLDLLEYQQFMEILNSFNEGTESVADLYKQIEIILGNKHQDLMEEFLTFLTPAQAKGIGKLIPYYRLSHMSLFLTKLEIYFKEQPAQLRKIYRSLTDLSTCINVTMDRVKNTILPLLKGNNLLTDWFLQIFPCEPPPESLLKGPWEQVDVREVTSGEDPFETVAIPEEEDPYGGPNCICSCHKGEDLMFQSRSQHCTPCGIKFLQGRVYIQTGKGLRLANVTFNGNSEVDHIARLNCTSADKKRRRCEVSPAKQLTSPTKDSLPDEVRVTNDSEDDIECGRRKARLTKSPRKKRVKLSEKHDKLAGKNEQAAVLECPVEVEVTPSVSCDEHNILEECSQKVEGVVDDGVAVVNLEICDLTNLAKPVVEEVNEWDCNTSIESIEVRQSPEHSAESESEFCEESSQDNINTETDDSAEELESLSNSPVHSDNSNSNTSEEISWTRDEDKIILETLQKEGDREEAFVCISEQLGNRSVLQIKERFHTLMNLLQKMTSCASSAFKS